MIQDKNERVIETMEDWAEIYTSGNKTKHWKEGRSAYSIADYVINHNGLEKIHSRVKDVLQKEIKIERVIPEVEITFDKYGQGRVHDLGIYGENNSIFIGVEAKVDEPFGNLIIDTYLDSKIRQIGGESTKGPQRVEDLLGLHYGKPDKSVFNLRYQLLYSTVGTIGKITKQDATLRIESKFDISVLYIIVFKTHLYDDVKGIDNFRDYINFLNALNAEELECSRQDSRVHRLSIGDKELISIYEQVDLKSQD